MTRLLLLSFAVLFFLGCSTPSSTDAGEEEPGFFGRMVSSTKKLNPFGTTTEAEKAAAQAKALFKGLEMSMTVEPPMVNLSETREIVVTLKLQNRAKKLVQLDFPTTQRIEVLVRTNAGTLVEQWSEDQAFRNEPGMVTINPRERLEYRAVISTRDFAAGQDYIVEGFFPNYDPLRAEKTIAATR
jgi:hypothetical protein